ncbi:type II toxin-antitoxin system VapB family antitoxin [Streptomyces sp. B1866]|uniref:type II toxin-antitoxin system VapB family antitoxin n=1 Tax=Streptomyces sp. B1866 TaxID=3075431 RepID=UPI0028923859|nr:type II toxin-antitoxin system VapB family antitoxin [Streptomyces sp. B1866]MDT3398384.1 type II toxin-antitoxin system VapB family antitoxin [Streptomyces sp. B1866]
MARTVIDVDDDLLAQAAEIFGTKSKVATVNAALEDVIKRRQRASFLAWLAEGGLPDLTGPVDTPGEPHRAA